MSKLADGFGCGKTFVSFIGLLRELHITHYDGPFLFDNSLGSIILDIAPLPVVAKQDLTPVKAEPAAEPEPVLDDGLTKTQADLLYSSSR